MSRFKRTAKRLLGAALIVILGSAAAAVIIWNEADREFEQAQLHHWNGQ